MNHINQQRFLRPILLLLILSLGITGCSLQSAKTLSAAAIQDISGSSGTTLFITNNGELWVAGLNDLGQLGIGQSDSRLKEASGSGQAYLPQPVKIADNVLQAVGLTGSSAYLTKTGDLWVMGDSEQLKNFPEVRAKPQGSVAQSVAATKVLTEVKQIAAGYNHLLILMQNSDLYGVGSNTWGQLGSNELSQDKQLVAQNVTAVFAGYGSTFYLQGDGQLYACGRNAYGELGVGQPSKGEDWPNTDPKMHFPPRLVTDNVQSVVSQGDVTLILKQDGKLYGLGLNVQDVYQNGVSYTAELVQLAEQVTKIGVTLIDDRPLLAQLTQSGKLLGWGAPVSSLVATNQTADQQWTELLPNVQNFWSTVGNLFVLTKDGKLHAAGSNETGQLAGFTWK